MLSEDSALKAIYDGHGGILEGLRPGSIGVDMSTVGPATTLSLGKRVRAAGASLVDALQRQLIDFESEGVRSSNGCWRRNTLIYPR